MLKMAGINYNKASLEQRERFSFTRHTIKGALNEIIENYNIDGCVIISTCNRTELYISTEEIDLDIFEILCNIKNIDKSEFENIFIEKVEDEVVNYIFQLACGMKSKIFGEDQIITQVKDAITFSRECNCTNVVLEKLFQIAITCAKKIKTEIKLTKVDSSVVENMLDILKSVNSKKCLVIGNGEIGRLCAKRLLENNFDVTMTLRQYKNKNAVIPQGCKVIDYKIRYNYIKNFDIIVSATSSPHHTIKYEETKDILDDKKERILIDLAVPRDISIRLGELENIKLYNIDMLGKVSKDKINIDEVKKANIIIEEYKEEFYKFYFFRNYIPIIHFIGRNAGEKTCIKLRKNLKNYLQDEEIKIQFEREIKNAAEKVVENMLFSLRENLNKDLWQDCIEAIEKGVI